MYMYTCIGTCTCINRSPDCLLSWQEEGPAVLVLREEEVEIGLERGPEGRGEGSREGRREERRDEGRRNEGGMEGGREGEGRREREGVTGGGREGGRGRGRGQHSRNGLMHHTCTSTYMYIKC